MKIVNRKSHIEITIMGAVCVIVKSQETGFIIKTSQNELENTLIKFLLKYYFTVFEDSKYTSFKLLADDLNKFVHDTLDTMFELERKNKVKEIKC